MLKEQIQPTADWDYRAANTKTYTHGIHPYPAMMIPQVARRLIHEYGAGVGVLFDPYCGTGTTLLEGMLADLQAVGTDLNPLARLIAKTKTTPLDIGHLDRVINDFVGFGLDSTSSAAAHPTWLSIPNVDYWFSERVQRLLALARDFIDRIDSVDIADFFRVAFSLTVRKVSWTKASEFKLVRMPSKHMASHNPDVFGVMVGILRHNRNAFESLNSTLNSQQNSPAVYGFNSVFGIPNDVVPPESVDLVVTSPPYGDSRTTVAYGQFSRLSSQWLGYEDATRVDDELMGGRPFFEDVSFGTPRLDFVIREIADSDIRRSAEVASFFVDYRNSIRNVAGAIKPGGYACYVVGNRTVKGFEVPTAEATAGFFEESGFTHVATFQRNIPNKRMPSVNSPTNIPGQLGNTMKAESIVICRRDTR